MLGFSSGVFGLYETPDCTNIHTLSVGQSRIDTNDVNATGDWLAFGCARLGQLLVWEWQSETYVLKQQGHGYGLNCTAFGSTGAVCATGGDDSKVKLWSTTSGFCFVTFSEHEAPVTAVKFTPNASAVLSSSLDGTVRAHDLVRYKNFRTLVTPQPAQLTSLALDSSGEVVVAGAMDPFEVYIWSLQTGRLLDVLAGHEAPLSELAFSPSQGVLASASWDGTVKLWDVYKNECVETLEMPADVLAVSFRPDGRQLCCACLNGTLQLWGTDGGDNQGIIEGRRDIAGGRRAYDKVTAANSYHGKYFTSVDYTADGTCVVAAGHSKFVCIYECSQQILVKKFQISHNRSLDGVLDELHSGRLTEAGSLDMLDASDSDGERRPSGSNLPGAMRAADGSRLTREETRSSCVRFSPTGREWAACTTDGLLLYSLDEAAIFNPSDLDETVTTEATEAAIARREWAKAILMSLHLNERELRERAVDAVPQFEVDLTAAAIPAPYALRLFGVLADRLVHSPRLEFHLTWCLSALQCHGTYLRNLTSLESRAVGTMRALQRALTSHQNDLFKLCQENQYMLDFLGAIDEVQDKSAGVTADPTVLLGLEENQVAKGATIETSRMQTRGPPATKRARFPS